MAVKMRLMRMGKKHSPFYRVVVIDGRAPRDGRYIDLLGRYDPRQDPSVIEIDTDKAIDWLKKGAQPTDAVRKLLEISGAMSRYKVASGKIHTVAAKTPVPAAPAAAVEGVGADDAASDPAAEPAVIEDSAAEEPLTEEPTAEEADADVAEDPEEE
ncbi:MAG TPA: 30S ribosomal protein S16 [Acidimicrobiia bacterium]|nr:30S ribosomal protein S16 [Acidimicrobiia bacterium]